MPLQEVLGNEAAITLLSLNFRLFINELAAISHVFLKLWSTEDDDDAKRSLVIS